MSKVAIFLADGVEEIEALTVVDLLRRAEIIIDMVSVSEGCDVVGAHGIQVKADILCNQMIWDDYDMLVLPGGKVGTDHLNENTELKNQLLKFHEAGKMIAAICAAPSILGKIGILEGKKATCYPGFEDSLMGATYQIESVVCDENIITSRGVGTAIDFALAIMTHFCGVEKAMIMQDTIVYHE